jgi:hypothetical protein
LPAFKKIVLKPIRRRACRIAVLSKRAHPLGDGSFRHGEKIFNPPH